MKHQLEIVRAFESKLSECFKILSATTSASFAYADTARGLLVEATRSLKEAQMKDRIVYLETELNKLLINQE